MFRYILFSIEPLYHCAYLTDWEYTVLDGYFNTTFTFRQDSDIFLPYARVRLKPEYADRRQEGRWLEKSELLLNGSHILKPKNKYVNKKYLRNKIY